MKSSGAGQGEVIKNYPLLPWRLAKQEQIMAVLQIFNITRTMSNVLTLQNVSMQVNDHEFVVILGPSGCGKSTLLHIAAGLLCPDQGSIIINDEDFTGKTGRCSYMQQKDLLLDSRTILDNVALPLLLKGVSKQEARRRAEPLLPEFGLAGFSTSYPRQLSGGMRQRAALLRTYLFSSDIMLLDEPFASLDAITRRKMHLHLLNLQKRYQSSILFVTHDIEEALLLANRIYVLSARPARVKAEINVDASKQKSDALFKLKENILSLLEDEEE